MDREKFIKQTSETFYQEVLYGSDTFRSEVFKIFDVSTSQDAKNTFLALTEGMTTNHDVKHFS